LRRERKITSKVALKKRLDRLELDADPPEDLELLDMLKARDILERLIQKDGQLVAAEEKLWLVKYLKLSDVQTKLLLER
jgi:CTP-dependent riboflavin kinase